MPDAKRLTDTIPRASIEQILDGLRFLATQSGSATFDAVRTHLLSKSNRKAPKTATASWTVARDVLTELDKLKLATVGVLPRKLSDVDRLRETPCQVTPSGSDMAKLHAEEAGRAYDTLLLIWLAEHSYFRRLMVRLLESPLYIPDVTSIGQVGLDTVKGTAVPAISANLVSNCITRMEEVGWTSAKIAAMRSGIEQRAKNASAEFDAADIDAKRLIDVIQDGIVLPAFLEAEGLPFDPVTFQQLLKCSQDFLSGGWTASLPRFAGRVVFSTCDFDVPLALDVSISATKVVHHGVSFAGPLFADAIRKAYISAAGASSPYVSAYTIRAMVCVELRLPLAVFARCLEALISAGPQADLTIYTELPFGPPPQGENYVEVSRRRIGRLKLVHKTGA